MIRRCELCGSEKRGEDAKFAEGHPIEVHDKWWRAMHKPGCAYLKIEERTMYIAEHGSPLSSVLEE
jgi:hypothetical protein